MATTIGTITLDGSFTDWLAAQPLENAANASPNYQIYGALINDPTLGENYVIGLDATGSNDPVIARRHRDLFEHGSKQYDRLQPIRCRERGRRV